jgi:hypothetical protein
MPEKTRCIFMGRIYIQIQHGTGGRLKKNNKKQRARQSGGINNVTVSSGGVKGWLHIGK